MLITQIAKQKKERKRYNIYLDNEFYCGLYEDTIAKFGLCKGDEITEKKINEIINFDEYIYGKKLAFDYLSYRLRTEGEIRKKLKEKNISQDSVERVIKHLYELGLVNDREFALQLVEEKIRRKPAGKQALRQKLYEKGISGDIADEVLSSVFAGVDEKSLVLKCFMKYKPRLKGELNTQKKKAFDYLAGKGFTFSVIKEVINGNIK